MPRTYALAPRDRKHGRVCGQPNNGLKGLEDPVPFPVRMPRRKEWCCGHDDDVLVKDALVRVANLTANIQRFAIQSEKFSRWVSSVDQGILR